MRKQITPNNAGIVELRHGHRIWGKYHPESGVIQFKLGQEAVTFNLKEIDKQVLQKPEK